MTYRILKRSASGLITGRLTTRFATRAEAQAAADQRGWSVEFITPKGFRAISWCFDDGTVRTGYTDGTMWNGFNNVWVLPEVRDEIVASADADWDDLTVAMLRHEPTNANGLVSLAYGYATTEIEG
jgi:hypothetical protein